MADNNQADDNIAGPSSGVRQVPVAPSRPSGEGDAPRTESPSDAISRSLERIHALAISDPAVQARAAGAEDSDDGSYSEEHVSAGEGAGSEVQGQFLVRALFDFEASNVSALSFKADDVIDVVTMLDSGWWDGMLGNARGWFPSNYVVVLDQDVQDELERRRFGVVADDEVKGDGLAEEEVAVRSALNRRTILAEEALGIDDALGGDWGGENDDLEALARSMGVGAEGAQEEPREVGDEFMLAARRQRARADTIDSTSSLSPIKKAGPSHQRQLSDPRTYVDTARDTGRESRAEAIEEEEEGEFGVGLLRGAESRRREREGTAGTIRGTDTGYATPLAGRRVQGQETPRPPARRDSAEASAGSGSGEGDDDAWIPSLTPDGQVYYHNTHTGEDSWDLPVPAPDEDDMYEDESTDYFPTPASRPASSNYDASTPDPGGGGFRAPPKTNKDIPHPWISRLSDDGLQWFYVNRLTGQESFDFPTVEVVRRESDAMGMSEETAGDRAGNVPPPASRSAAAAEALIRKKASAEARAKSLADWERRSRHTLVIALRPAERSSLGIMLEIINDTLREVFEAAVAGSAAEEEMSRASDLNSETGRIAALLREDSAVEMLRSSHRDLLSAISDLLRAYGYVGPLDRLEDMSRPAWTGDMTLIGSIGVFSANVHAALRSKRVAESGLSVWQEVMRSGSKLRDVITDFPDVATDGAVTARPLWGWIGVEGPIGGLHGGRWGFGAEGSGRKVLDGDVVAGAEQIREEFDAALKAPLSEAGGLEMLRIAERFKASIDGVDLAGCIDVDGQADDGAVDENDVSRKYDDLVRQARSGLADLDRAVRNIDLHSSAYYLALAHAPLTPSSDATVALTSLGAAIATSARSLSNLLIVASEQKGMMKSTTAKGRIGFRSPRYNQLVIEMGNTRHRPPSIVSTHSRRSRASGSSAIEAKRSKARGLEDDFQESEERLELSTQGGHELTQGSGRRQGQLQSQQRADRDSGGASRNTESPISASGSQGSLARVAAGPSGSGHRPQPSAGSSTTSLAYQRTESDAGSGKGGNRASTMMLGFFGRGNKSNDNESDARAKDRGEKPEKSKIMKERGNRKLAKLLGEDAARAASKVITPPPGSASFGHQQQQPLLQRQISQSQSPNLYDGRTPLSGSFASIPPSQHAETPWYLAEDYGPEDIVFDDKGGVKAGTLKALVARLTPHESADTSFFQAFMLTFRSFTSGDRLFDLLSDRHHIQPPEGMDEMQEADWVKLKQTPIRLRVTNVIRAWLDVHFMVDQDMEMLDKFERFAKESMVDTTGEMLGMLSKTLLSLIARRRRGEDPSQRRILSGGSLSPPAPLLPRISGRQLQLTDIPPLEFARQLTIIEFNNFQKIRPVECLHKLWTAEDETKARNVRLVIHTANKLAAWIGLLVLQPKDAKSRASLMKYFIQCATELRNINNFSSMAGIIAGLNAAPVDRLKRTKEQLSSKSTQMKEDLDRTMDSSKNFANYKDMLKTINPPCVPFLGFYLSALTFIEDGNKDIVKRTTPNSGMPNSASSSSLSSGLSPGFSINRSPIQPLTASTTATPSSAITTTTSTATPDPNAPPKEPLINFFKRSLSAEILRDIQQYQSQPYNLAKCRPVYEFLVHGLEKVETGGAGNDLYERSLLLEPREREEERIQRMLHDSGFI